MLGRAPARALDELCRPNNVQFIETDGQLVITEYAITQSYPECPSAADNLGDVFSANLNENIHLWFRLEGDDALLDSIGPASRFTATIRRWNSEDDSSSFLTLDEDRIGVSAARRETRLMGGHFDWRFRVAVTSFLAPGNYELQLLFDDRPICIAAGPCQVSFNIPDPDAQADDGGT